MGFVKLLIALVLAGSAVLLFTLPFLLDDPERPGGEYSLSPYKKRPGDTIRGKAEGPKSIRGMRKVIQIQAWLESDSKDQRLKVPVQSTTPDDTWEDTLSAPEGSAARVEYAASPLPNDPALSGRSFNLVVRADVSYPEDEWSKSARGLLKPEPTATQTRDRDGDRASHVLR